MAVLRPAQRLGLGGREQLRLRPVLEPDAVERRLEMRLVARTADRQ
jgi:hypothetical protein